MKTRSFFIITLIFGSILFSGCAIRSTPSQAPGQVKKVTGSKSAKPYAPGQKKKEH